MSGARPGEEQRALLTGISLRRSAVCGRTLAQRAENRGKTFVVLLRTRETVICRRRCTPNKNAAGNPCGAAWF